MSGKIPDDRGFYFLPTVPDFADISDNRHKSVPETPCSILYLPPPPNWWRVFEYGGSDFFFLKKKLTKFGPLHWVGQIFQKCWLKMNPSDFIFSKGTGNISRIRQNFKGLVPIIFRGRGLGLQIKNGMSLPPWYLILHHTGFSWLSKENILIFVTLETSLG